jgi:hypothetical protein
MGKCLFATSLAMLANLWTAAVVVRTEIPQAAQVVSMLLAGLAYGVLSRGHCQVNRPCRPDLHSAAGKHADGYLHGNCWTFGSP